MLHLQPKKGVKCLGSMRAYSLGVIIVAVTVGSQHVVTRLPGFEANAAGFWTCILLRKRPIHIIC